MLVLRIFRWMQLIDMTETQAATSVCTRDISGRNLRMSLLETNFKTRFV
jgi:hypothetical protein